MLTECFCFQLSKLVVQCPELPDPRNGKINYDPDVFHQAEATVICNDGYVTNGIVRRCEGDNTWSGGELSCRGM